MERRDFLKLGGSAGLSAVVHLSVQSVAKKSVSIDFPDFTRGRWKTHPPLPIVHM